jgi:glutathione synthase/RimK-type ligase-like ATP-grasp enzyme
MNKFRIRVASRHPSHKAIIKHGQMPKFPVRVRVRFGSQIPHRPCVIDFNSIESIRRTSNKSAMKRTFQMHGVKSPKYLENNQVNRDRIINGDLGDMIVFKTTYHSRGIGMIVCDNSEVGDIHSAGYFEESQISEREFRVHVMDGEAFYIDEKRPRERMEEQPIVKNMKAGYKFRRPLKEFPDEVITESVKAVKALGLDFGAADVGVNEDGVWIYEVNTAPSLRTKTRKLYQKALVKAIWKRILGEERIEEVEQKSREYNEWLDAQPLTPHTSELNNQNDG